MSPNDFSQLDQLVVARSAAAVVGDLEVLDLAGQAGVGDLGHGLVGGGRVAALGGVEGGGVEGEVVGRGRRSGAAAAGSAAAAIRAAAAAASALRTRPIGSPSRGPKRRPAF